MESYAECEEESSCVVLFCLSDLKNDMTVDKMLGIIQRPRVESSLFNSLCDYKINQLLYCKVVALVSSMPL